MKWLCVKEPSLVSSVVACPPDDLVVISVTGFVDVETLSSWVSEVSESSWIERDLLVSLISPWSDDKVVVNLELSVDLG